MFIIKRFLRNMKIVKIIITSTILVLLLSCSTINNEYRSEDSIMTLKKGDSGEPLVLLREIINKGGEKWSFVCCYVVILNN